MSIKTDQAFISTILDGGLEIDIVYENGLYSTWTGSAYTSGMGIYTPDANREFIEVKTFPAGKEAFSLAHSDESQGFFQVVVRYPLDVGAIGAKTKAEEVLALLKIGSRLTYSGDTVHIVSNSRDGGFIDAGFYQIVVRANYLSLTTRA